MRCERRCSSCCACGNMALSQWEGTHCPLEMAELREKCQGKTELGGVGVNFREGSWTHPPADPEQLGEPCKVKSLNYLQKRKPRRMPALTWITALQWQSWGPQRRGLLRELGFHEEQRTSKGRDSRASAPKSESQCFSRTHRVSRATRSALHDSYSFTFPMTL